MQQRIIDTIFLLSKECMLRQESSYTEENLSQTEFAAIESLEIDEKTSCNAISERLGRSVSRSSRIIDQLVRKGYLIRKTDPGDRRAVAISLSSKGIKCKKMIEKAKDDCEKRILNSINGKNLDIVKKGVKILTEAMKKNIS